MSSPLIEAVVTTEDLNTLKHELEVVQAALYQTKPEVLDKVFKDELRADVARALTENFQHNPEIRQHIIEGLQKELSHLEIAHLTLAFEPTPRMIGKIADWIRDHVGPNIVLEFAYDPRILGGATISFAGQYADFSLQKKLTDVLKPIVQKKLGLGELQAVSNKAASS